MSDKVREANIRAAEGALEDFERMWRRAMKREIDILANDGLAQDYVAVDAALRAMRTRLTTLHEEAI